jgi:hypothetical protein
VAQIDFRIGEIVMALYYLGCRKPSASRVRIRGRWTTGEMGTAPASNMWGTYWVASGEVGKAEEAAGGHRWLVERGRGYEGEAILIKNDMSERSRCGW